MKLIDFNPAADKGLGVLDQFLGSIGLGSARSKELRAHQSVINAFQRGLDNRHFLLRNVKLEGLDAPIPLVMVAPSGVRVLYPCGLRGIFRIKMDTWEQLDESQKRYRPIRPNILSRAAQMARALGDFLSSRSIDPLEIEALVIFTHPGTHVEMQRPSVRIVLADALNRLAAAVMKMEPKLEKQEVQRIVELLSEVSTPSSQRKVVTSDQDAFSLQDQPGRSQVDDLVERMPRGEGIVKTLNKIPFSTGQWILISLLVIVNIVILAAFVLLVLLVP